MNQDRTQVRRLYAACKKSLVFAGLIAALAACGQSDPTNPNSPSGPPRPVTSVGNVTTAHMDLPARPVPPSPGQM